MKKLVLFAVAAMALSFASCGNKTVDPAAEQKRIEDSIAAADAAKAQEEALKNDTTAQADTTVKAEEAAPAVK